MQNPALKKGKFVHSVNSLNKKIILSKGQSMSVQIIILKMLIKTKDLNHLKIF